MTLSSVLRTTMFDKIDGKIQFIQSLYGNTCTQNVLEYVGPSKYCISIFFSHERKIILAVKKIVICFET